MAELAMYVHHGASKITPKILKGIHRKLPLLKVAFAQIQAPKFPHLVNQLEFLTNVVEDFADGKADDLPFTTIAAAVFALIYVQQEFDLIPDNVPDFGMADDSGVVRVVLIQHERVLARYADKMGVKWTQVTVEP